MADLENLDQLRAWLGTQPREVSEAISSRAAMRMLPALGRSDVKNPERHRSMVILVVFRTLALCWAATTGSVRRPEIVALAATFIAEVERALERAAVATAVFEGDPPEAAEMARRALLSVDAVEYGFHALATFGVQSYDEVLAKAEDVLVYQEPHDGFRMYAADAAVISGGRSPAALVSRPLWNDALSGEMAEDWSTLKSHLLAANEGWEVWTDWYEARLRGDPFDAELERARALIPEEIWRQGPRAVNAGIARLIAARREAAHSAMLDRIAALEAQLAAPRAEGPAPIGHNNPPKTIRDEIQPPLDALRRQPVTPDTTAEAVAAVGRLRTALSRVTGYAGRKLDLFIDEAVREGGKQFGKWATIALVVGAATAWLRTLGVAP
jgi:hypothetical protein